MSIKSTKEVANLISDIFGPHLFLPAIILICIFGSGLDSAQIKVLLPVIFIFEFLLPMGAVQIARWKRWISGWDIPNRKQRIPFVLLFLFCSAICFFILKDFGNPLMFKLFISLVSVGVVFTVVTFFWKISFHIGLATLAISLLAYLFSPWYLVLYSLIFVIAWARIYLKRHTPAQVTAGFLVSLMVFYASMFWL